MIASKETSKAGAVDEFQSRSQPHRPDKAANLEAVMVRPCWANLPVATAEVSRNTRRAILFAALFLLGLAGALSAWAEEDAEVMAVEPVALLTAEELATLVAPVALYPDDLLAVVLPASTFPLQVVLAARFLEARKTDPSLEPDAAWDASIVALLNYPEIIALLDGDLRWTWKLGEAVLVQEQDVIAAVADFREQAALAGNLKSDGKQIVAVGEAGAIKITPVEREIIHIPYYDPEEVIRYQPTRVYHYHRRSYPVYYYPYTSRYHFSNGAFWGVSSAFSIGWRSRSLHWHHHGFHDHPYFGFSYHEPFYYRQPHIWLSGHHQTRLRRHDRRHHRDNRWYSDNRRGGPRPRYRPHRPGRETRPRGTDERTPDRQQPLEPPGGPTGRVINRSITTTPNKHGGHIPVEPSAGEREGAPLAGKEPSAGEREGAPLARKEPSAEVREQKPLKREKPSARKRGGTPPAKKKSRRQ